MAELSKMMKALRNADAAGDAEAAARIAGMIQNRGSAPATEETGQMEEGPDFIERLGEEFGRSGRSLARGTGQVLDVAANPLNYLIDKLVGTELGQRPFERGAEELMTAVGVPEYPPRGDAVEFITEFVAGLPAGGGIAKTISKGVKEIPGLLAETVSKVAAKQAPITAMETAAATAAGGGLAAGQELVEGADSETAQVAVPLVTSILAGLGIVPATAMVKGGAKQTVRGMQALAGKGDVPTGQVAVDVTDEFKKVMGLPQATPDEEIAQIVAQRVAQKADELRQGGVPDAEIAEILSVSSVFPELEGSAVFQKMGGADPKSSMQRARAMEIEAGARAEGMPEGDTEAARAFLAEGLGKERAGIERAVTGAEEALTAAERELVGGRAALTEETAGQAVTAAVAEGKRLKQVDVSAAYDEALGEAADRAFDTKPLKARMKGVVEEMGMTDMPTLKAAVDKAGTLDEFATVKKFSEFEQAVNNVNVKEMTDAERRVWGLAKDEILANLDDMAAGNIVSHETIEAATRPERVAIPEMVEKLGKAKTLAAEKGATFKAAGTGGKKIAVTPAGQIAKGKVLPEKVADAFIHGGVDDAKNFRAATKQLDDVGKVRAETALKDGLVNKFFDDLGNWKDAANGQKNFLKWFKRTRPALDELGADFNKQFATPADAIQALKKAQIDETAYNKTLRNKILTDVLEQPHAGWKEFRAVAKNDIVRETRKALASIKRSDNPDVLKKSLQASYGEYLGNAYASPEKFLNLLEGTTSDLKLERRVMDALMDKKQINALRKAATVAREAEKVKVSLGATPEREATEEIASLSKTLIGNIWLAFMGATIMSPQTAVTRGVYRGGRGKSAILRTQNMKEVMARAYTDPDYLVKLLEKTSPKKAQKDMKVYLWLARDRSEESEDE